MFFPTTVIYQLVYNPNVIINTITMFLRTEKKIQYYMRKGKHGHHPYKRKKTLVFFECDNCHEEFTRDKGQVDPKRLNNDYSHVCEKCDPKRFAQKVGVLQRKKLNVRVDTMVDISKM